MQTQAAPTQKCTHCIRSSARSHLAHVKDKFGGMPMMHIIEPAHVEHAFTAQVCITYRANIQRSIVAAMCSKESSECAARIDLERNKLADNLIWHVRSMCARAEMFKVEI